MYHYARLRPAMSTDLIMTVFRTSLDFSSSSYCCVNFLLFASLLVKNGTKNLFEPNNTQHTHTTIVSENHTGQRWRGETAAIFMININVLT